MSIDGPRRPLFEAAAASASRPMRPIPASRSARRCATPDGAVFAGCNVENAAYPVGTCAEAGAISAMIAAGERRIAAILVIGDGEALVTPCGACRQRIREFAGPDTPIHAAGRDGLRRSFTLDALLPFAFGPDNLEALMNDASLAPDANIAEAAAFLRGRGFDGRFDCAMVLGTGLGNLAEDLEDPVSVAYAETPHFPLSRGLRARRAVSSPGKIERKRVLLLQGRAHYYETGDAAAMRVPLGVVAALGVPPLLLTNAAGSIKLDLRPVEPRRDHRPHQPLGLEPALRDRSDARFVNLTGAYDERLRKKLKLAATAAGISLHEGVYMWFSGPSFETPAEIRMAQTLGADLVGMSTVPEVILARYFGLKVAALSVVTNMAAGIDGAAPSHAETKQKAAGAGAGLQAPDPGLRLRGSTMSDADDRPPHPALPRSHRSVRDLFRARHSTRSAGRR